MSDKNRFYLILAGELLLLPILYLAQWLNKKGFDIKSKPRRADRKPVLNRRVFVAIHEWGGYPLCRTKTIKHGITFECGLEYQLQRFQSYQNVRKVALTVTMSDVNKYSDFKRISSSGARVIPVSNMGMDFSGYFKFYESIKDKPNAYVILTNSSVHCSQDDFLDGYIKYMEQNPDVGALGVSYCTKIIQTFIRANFTPHLQSFFLLTTTQVLNEVVALNEGQFPGVGINHKLLLIREGEIRMSQLIQKLGYQLAVVNPLDGIPFKFTNYRNWPLPKGDIRQILREPNKITPIIKLRL